MDEKKPDVSTGQEERGLFIPISFKLITITSLIVVASLAGVAIAASFFFRGDNEARAIENTLNSSALIAQKIRSDLLSVAERTRTGLTAMNDIRAREQAGSTAESAAYQDFFFRRNPDIYYVAGMRRGDPAPYVEMKNSRSTAAATDMATVLAQHKDILDRTFSGEELLFNPSVYLNDSVTALAVPFEIVAGKPVIMVIVFSMEKFADSSAAGSVIRSFVVNGSGDVIAHYDSVIARSRTDLSELPIVKMMMGSTNPNGQTIYGEADGTRSLGAFQRIGFTGAAVISSVPESKAFEAVYKIQKIILYITIIALASAVIFIYFFSVSLTRPVSRLMEAVKYIQGGRFNVEVPATTRDEIGRLSSSFTEMAKGLAEREKMKDAFGRFVNKEIADLVLRDEVKLGGERKEVAVFFSDIRSFTAMSERMEPEEVVGFLNAYMSRMVGCVNSTLGVVDKFIGDSIMAVWGAPLSHGNDTERAIDAALMMRQALIEFNRGRGGTRGPVIHIGIGINTGPVLAGQIGTEERMEYTVIGDTVNLASRIEALNKPFGTDILISAGAYEKVRHSFIFEPMRRITVKGKSDPIRIYAVIGRRDDPSGPKNLEDVRMLTGIRPPEKDLLSGDDSVYEEKELKYEIIE